ncbi:hypothetical protein B7463_g8010, partial [Scytalidium lignicola]
MSLQFRAMSSTRHHSDPAIDQVLSYWFNEDERYPNPVIKWYDGGQKVDQEIRSKFSELILSARSKSLDSWTETANGTLALLLLLDQFPRNAYRGKPDACASETLALETANLAIAKGQDLQVPYLHQHFFLYALPTLRDFTWSNCGCKFV